MTIRRFELMLLRFWKRWLPQTLMGRSLLILILPLFLTLSIGLFVFFDRHWSTTTVRLADTLAGEVAVIVEAWERAPSVKEQQRLARLAEKKLGLHLTYKKGGQLSQKKKLQIPGLVRPLDRAFEEKLNRPFSVGQRHDSTVIISLPVPGGMLEVALPQKRLFSTTTYVFLLFMIGSGLLLSTIALIFMRNQIRPVRQLAMAAEQFGKGIDNISFKATGAREVRQAAEAFLEMRDRIRRQIKQRTDMLTGVSHDLRTPLTRMKLQLAFLPTNTDTDAMRHDIDAMERMITAYLDFARNEHLENPLRSDIVSLLEQAIRDAERHGLKVTCTLPDMAVVAMIRPQALIRVFSNILDNTRLYAHDSWVTVNKDATKVEILFDDDGPGIPAERRQDVFKPFHRLDQSRNQDIEGTGLGLTIARDIVQSHGGTIRLDQSPMNGLRVIVELPV